MIQGKTRILELVSCYDIVSPLVLENINGVHIDLHLGDTLKTYTSDIDLHHEPQTKEIKIDENGYVLKPGDFVLASTLETVEIPLGYYGFIETKGNISRAGLSSHNTDGHIDPGYRGKITLEIKNHANVNVKIYPGIKFVQLFLFRVEGEMAMYKGKYQDSVGPTSFHPDILAVTLKKAVGAV